jgi:hypothetical protein
MRHAEWALLPGEDKTMQLLENESVFLSLLLADFALWSTQREPGVFTSLLVLITALGAAYMVLRMAINRL